MNLTNAQRIVADLHPSSSLFDMTAEQLADEGYAADFIAAIEDARSTECNCDAPFDRCTHGLADDGVDFEPSPDPDWMNP